MKILIEIDKTLERRITQNAHGNSRSRKAQIQFDLAKLYNVPTETELEIENTQQTNLNLKSEII